jgi:hypothetical protein
MRREAKPTFEELLRSSSRLSGSDESPAFRRTLTSSSPPPGSYEPVGQKKIDLAGINLCCDLLDLGLDDLDPAGGVDGLDCLEEIP